MKKFFILLSCIVFLSGVSFTAEKSKREKRTDGKTTAIGFNSQLSDLGLTSLAIRHWASKKIALEGIFGFSVGDDKIFDLGGKLIGLIKSQQNLNYYWFGLLGIENYDIQATNQNDTTVTVGAGLGFEFCISQIPNLYFGIEYGLGYDSASEQFGTFGNWLSSVGIRYYVN